MLLLTFNINKLILAVSKAPYDEELHTASQGPVFYHPSFMIE
ncbi:hypothetical protein [Desulfosporosinus sp. OT]|nr:hypothetical protein [Desulfosporosinus sp. OT]EGW38768.1 hypothetical protein DOT_3237 [Desulfosporosinus sp. OT]